MERDSHLIISAILYFVSVLIYILFELFAPYCAKHVCCSSSGGYWSMIPLVIVFVVIVATVELFNGIFFWKEEKK